MKKEKTIAKNKSLTLFTDGSVSVFEKDGRAAINCVLAAGQNNYLNPEYVAKAAGGTDYDILRTGVFLEDGETEFR